MDQDFTQDNPMDPPAFDMITVGHIPLAKLGLVPFTPSNHHTVACLDTIFFDKASKTIVRRSKKRLNIGTQPDVIILTKKTVVEHG